jgi:hypothetical protein
MRISDPSDVSEKVVAPENRKAPKETNLEGEKQRFHF